MGEDCLRQAAMPAFRGITVPCRTTQYCCHSAVMDLCRAGARRAIRHGGMVPVRPGKARGGAACVPRDAAAPS